MHSSASSCSSTADELAAAVVVRLDVGIAELAAAAPLEVGIAAMQSSSSSVSQSSPTVVTERRRSRRSALRFPRAAALGLTSTALCSISRSAAPPSIGTEVGCASSICSISYISSSSEIRSITTVDAMHAGVAQEHWSDGQLQRRRASELSGRPQEERLPRNECEAKSRNGVKVRPIELSRVE